MRKRVFLACDHRLIMENKWRKESYFLFEIFVTNFKFAPFYVIEFLRNNFYVRNVRNDIQV